MIHLQLPWPPTMNTYWRSVPGQGVKISEKGRAFRRAVSDCVLVQRAAKLYTGRLGVHIVAYPPDKRTRDLDNILKPLLDAMTRYGCWADDEQVDDLHIIRSGLFKGGRVDIQVWELSA